VKRRQGGVWNDLNQSTRAAKAAEADPACAAVSTADVQSGCVPSQAEGSNGNRAAPAAGSASVSAAGSPAAATAAAHGDDLTVDDERPWRWGQGYVAAVARACSSAGVAGRPAGSAGDGDIATDGDLAAAGGDVDGPAVSTARAADGINATGDRDITCGAGECDAAPGAAGSRDIDPAGERDGTTRALKLNSSALAAQAAGASGSTQAADGVDITGGNRAQGANRNISARSTIAAGSRAACATVATIGVDVAK